MYGPMQFSVIGFDNNDALDGLFYELDLVREIGIIRLVDMLVLAKDKFGNSYTLEVSDYTDEERMEFGAVIGALIGLGAAGEDGAMAGAEAGALAVAENDFGVLGEDLREVVEDLPAGTSAVIVLFEHTWALRIKEFALNNGGFPVAQGLLHPSTFVEIGTVLSEQVALAAELEDEELKEEEAAAKKGTSTKKMNASKTKKTK